MKKISTLKNRNAKLKKVFAQMRRKLEEKVNTANVVMRTAGNDFLLPQNEASSRKLEDSEMVKQSFQVRALKLREKELVEGRLRAWIPDSCDELECQK